MPTTTAKRRAIEATVTGAVVLFAALLPWGKVDFTKVNVSANGEIGDGMNQIFSALGVVPVTAWNGHARVGGLKLPNLLVPLAAIAVMVLCWLRAASVWKVHPAVGITFAGYGLAHSAYVLISLMGSAEGTPGIGIFLTTMALGWLLVVLLRQETVPEKSEFALARKE